MSIPALLFLILAPQDTPVQAKMGFPNGSDPAHQSWTDYKPGSSVTYSVNGRRVRQTLMKVEKGSAVFRTIRPNSKPGTAGLVVAPNGLKVDSATTEKATVDGKTFVSARTKYARGGIPVHREAWFCKDAPGGAVKTNNGRLVTLSEKIKVGGKEYDCFVWEFKERYESMIGPGPGGDIIIREWRSEKVLGFLVKRLETWTGSTNKTIKVELFSVKARKK